MADSKAQKRAKFEGVYPVLREELLAYLKQEGMPQDAVAWFQRVRPSFSPRYFWEIVAILTCGARDDWCRIWTTTCRAGS